MIWSNWSTTRVLIGNVSYDIKSRHMGGTPFILIRHGPWSKVRLISSEIVTKIEPDKYLSRSSVIEIRSENPAMLEMQIGLTPKQDEWFGIDNQVSGATRISASI